MRVRVSFPHNPWPSADQRLWDSAFAAPVDLFDDEARGAALAEATRRDLHYAYTRWLGFLALHEPAALDLPPARRVTVERIRRMVDALTPTNAPKSIGSRLHHLRLALKLMAPDEDWGWLKAIADRHLRMRRPRVNRPLELAAACDEAQRQLAVLSGEPPSRASAIAYRDALIVALLCEAPIRRRNLVQIRIGTHLVREGDSWALIFGPDETKNKRPLDYPLSPELSQSIDTYLSRFRPKLPGAAGHDGLWASNKSGPLRETAMLDTVGQWTAKHLGYRATLHAFRRAAGSLHAKHNPANVRVARDLLGHADLATTQHHYIEAETRQAAVMLQAAVREARRRP